jgi:reactive intermediate/imine deaminase
VHREVVQTHQAPSAIGTYSQAIKVGDAVYLSGQIPLDPRTMEMVEGGFEAQAERVFENLKMVAQAAGGSLADVVKLNVFLTDLVHFPAVNQVMGRFFEAPYPARAAVQVAALPKAALIEVDAIMHLRGKT